MRILVHLHFLGGGIHVRETVPAMIAAARAEFPALSIETTAPIGDDPRLVDIVVERMGEAEQG